MTDRGAISLVTSQNSSLGLRNAKYLSVIQCEKAFEIILAASSMKSLFWLLHIASRSACHYSSCISWLAHVISNIAHVVSQVPQVPQYRKKCGQRPTSVLDKELEEKAENPWRSVNGPLAFDGVSTDDTRAECSWNASPGRLFATWVQTSTYWIAISSHGVTMLPLYLFSSTR